MVHEVLPLWIRINLGVMARKEYSTFFNVLGQELDHQMMFSVIFRRLIGGCLTPSAEIQSAYSKAPFKWAAGRRSVMKKLFQTSIWDANEDDIFCSTVKISNQLFPLFCCMN